MALSATCLWASVDDVKPYLGLKTSDTATDAVLTTLAEGISQDLERLTGRVFVQRAKSERLNGDGSPRVWLTWFPVAALTLTVNDTALVLDTDVVLDAESGLIRRIDCKVFSRGVANIVAAYNAGWVRAQVPASVTQLALEMLKLKWDEWRAGAISATSVNLGSASMVIKPGWPYQVRDAMEALKREGRP